MKTIIWNSLIGCSLLLSCNISPVLEEEEVCPLPVFQAPTYSPHNEDCLNSCIYVYEGQVNFAEQTLQINCQDLPTQSDLISWYIDKIPVKQQDHGRDLIRSFHLKIPNLHRICKDFFQWEYQGACPDAEIVEMLAYTSGPNTGLRIIPDPSFWECYDAERADFKFRFTTTAPIVLEGTNP